MNVPTNVFRQRTWSLLGVEKAEADSSENAREKNFTNDGGVDHRIEATAIGNILSQMLSDKTFGSIAEAREAVFNSFDVKEILVRWQRKRDL